MESNWAAENLQTIRTLMERSALYRRALAPIMTLAGGIGTLAAICGLMMKVIAPIYFELYWLVVGLVVLGVVYLLVRRQALNDAEPFWSTPTRRVTQALLPSFTSGFILSILAYIFFTRKTGEPWPESIGNLVLMFWLPVVWIILYGCGLHAAGFFMPRGIRVFGWAFIIGGCIAFAIGVPDILPGFYGHILMGIFFGLLQLAYGVYLYFTEKRKNAA